MKFGAIYGVLVLVPGCATQVGLGQSGIQNPALPHSPERHGYDPASSQGTTLTDQTFGVDTGARIFYRPQPHSRVRPAEQN